MIALMAGHQTPPARARAGCSPGAILARARDAWSGPLDPVQAPSVPRWRGLSTPPGPRRCSAGAPTAIPEQR